MLAAQNRTARLNPAWNRFIAKHPKERRTSHPVPHRVAQWEHPLRPGDDIKMVESVAAVLQEGGHETLLCEGDKGLLATLERFMPPDPQAVPPESS